MKVTKLDDTITIGRHKGKTVREMIESSGDKARRNIMSLLKKGLYFDDEVINMVGIKKTIRDPVIKLVVADHKTDHKVLPKDRAKLSTILKDIHTIDTSIDDYPIDDEENE